MQPSQEKYIEISGINKTFDSSVGPVLENVSFTIPKGAIVALVGSSGSGKTTLLRIIAGFEPVNAGEVHVNGELFTSESYIMPTEHRKIGMVFQDYALFPHLTVKKNILFGITKLAFRERNYRLRELLSMSNLEREENSFPHELSGGQRQRVAIARALAPKNKLLILDEPFNSIDLHLKDSMLESLRENLVQEEITTIFVTHDRDEAFRIADHIILLHHGQLIQQGTPEHIYSQPHSIFTARFFGKCNIIPAKSHGDHVITPIGNIALNRIHSYTRDEDISALVIRPSMFLIEEHDDESCVCCRGKLIATRFYGSHQEARLLVQKHLLTCICPTHLHLHIGKSYCLSLQDSAIPAALYTER